MAVDNPTTTYDNTSGKIPGFLLSGYYYTGGAGYLGSNGSYWSRTAYSAQDAHNLNLHTSNVGPGGSRSKSYGFAVRCVVQINQKLPHLQGSFWRGVTLQI